MPREPFNPDRIKVPPEEQLFAAPAKPAGTGEKPLTVTELTGLVKRALASLPTRLAVAGEVSNVTHSPNGHLYFTLKDEGACVDCVMWRSDAARLKFRMADGLAVIALGQIDLYAPRGRYQLYVTRLTPSGHGELELAYRQLYEKLARLGWFASERKRPIPRIPQTIGVVTSRTGAAIRDILRTLALRWPAARVVVADARVQGEGSAESVAAAIKLVNRHASALGGVDVLIVARGGGSLEDLWSFNTDIVARAILDSRIPVVSGVGHEVDTTIADLVADLRAATPTAAAQAVAPDHREVRAQLDALLRLARGAARRRLDDWTRRIAAAARSEMLRRPEAMLRVRRQQLDEWVGRLHAAQRDRLHVLARAIGDLGQRLGRQHPRAMLLARWRGLETLTGRLRWGLTRSNLGRDRQLATLAVRFAQLSPLAQPTQRVETLQRQLTAYDPRAVLRRGYSMTTLKDTGELVVRIEQVRVGATLVTELSDGRVESSVTAAGDATTPPTAPQRQTRAKKKPACPDATNLPTLFEGTNRGEECTE